MTATIDVLDVTEALLLTLRTALPGFPIGDHEAPGDLDELVDADQRWGIVYHVAGGATFGDAQQLSSTRTLIYQFTGVGDRRDKAQGMASKMTEAALTLSKPIVPGTSKVIGRWHTESGGCVPEGTLWNAVEKVALLVSV